MAKTNKKQNRQIHLLNKFIKVFFLSFAVFIIIAALGTIAYIQVASSNIEKSLKDNTVIAGESLDSIEGGLSDEEANPLLDTAITTFALFGVDEEGYRTDVIMLAFFHHDSGIIDMVSIPRDTYIKIPDDIFAEISARSNNATQFTKINAVPAWIEAKNRNEKQVEVIESVFGVDVDYYINMDLAGFKNIVDAVGPVMFDVPVDMDYVDMEQGEEGLIIKLEAGLQEIWGPQAEDLIRFRSYEDGTADIGRIHTQHEFMKAFVNTVLEPQNRFNMISLLETVLVYMETDFEDAVDYLIFLDDLSADKVNFYTLPGSNGAGGTWEYDFDDTKAMFQEILNRDTEPVADNTDDGTDTDQSDTTNDGNETDPEEEPEDVIEVEPVEIHDAKDFTISVQNGTKIPRLAGRTRDMLVGEGYDVIDASNYDTNTLEKTIITAPYQEVAEQLARYFRNPEIVIDEALVDAEWQVIIAIGSVDDDGQSE